jgi:hypothetical protein
VRWLKPVNETSLSCGAAGTEPASAAASCFDHSRLSAVCRYRIAACREEYGRTHDKPDSNMPRSSIQHPRKGPTSCGVMTLVIVAASKTFIGRLTAVLLWACRGSHRCARHNA